MILFLLGFEENIPVLEKDSFHLFPLLKVNFSQRWSHFLQQFQELFENAKNLVNLSYFASIQEVGVPWVLYI